MLSGEQLDLPGFSAATAPSENLFFALLPDSATARRMEWNASDFCALHGMKGKPLAPDRLHVSLHPLGRFCGELPPGLLRTAREAACRVAKAPFEVTFDRVASFSGGSHRRPFVLYAKVGCEALASFHRHLGGKMAQAGLSCGTTRRFVPHVTLLCGHTRFAERRVEPITWTVYDFVLVHGKLGQSRYHILGRWRLNDS